MSPCSAAHNDFVEFSVQEVDNAILQLKRRKVADAALLTAEHVIYANHILSELLCLFFQCLLQTWLSVCIFHCCASY